LDACYLPSHIGRDVTTIEAWAVLDEESTGSTPRDDGGLTVVTPPSCFFRMSVGYRLRTLPYNPFDSGVSIYDFLMALADTLHPPMTYDFCRLGPGAALSLAAIVGCLPGCRSSLAGQQPGPQAPPGEVWLSAEQVAEAKIEVQAVEDQTVDDTVLTSGRVVLDDDRVAHIFSPVSGRIVRIDAQLGERVKKGQALATIESPDVGSAVSDVQKAQANLIAAEHDFMRQSALVLEHAASQALLEQSEDNWRKTKTELERARQKTYLLRTGAIDGVSQTYTLQAPIDGTVLLRTVSPGVEVQGQYGGGQAVELFTLGELSRAWVMADLYEADLGRVRVGCPALVSVISHKDRVFTGTVDWVSGTLDPTTRTARVRATFDNAEGLLRPEMYATARFAVEKKRLLAIPKGALLRLGEYGVVFVELDSANGRTRFERVPVDVDETESTEWLAIKHGLERGQRVVTRGAALLSQRL